MANSIEVFMRTDTLPLDVNGPLLEGSVSTFVQTTLYYITATFRHLLFRFTANVTVCVALAHSIRLTEYNPIGYESTVSLHNQTLPGACTSIVPS